MLVGGRSARIDLGLYGSKLVNVNATFLVLLSLLEEFVACDWSSEHS